MADYRNSPPHVLSEADIAAILRVCDETRYPIRNRVVILLACDAGLSPKEISKLRRSNVVGADNMQQDFIDVPGSRYLNPRRIHLSRKGRLWLAINALLKNAPATPNDPLIISQRACEGGGATTDPGAKSLTVMRPDSICYLFFKLFEKAGITAKPFDARATFIVNTAEHLTRFGIGVENVQYLSGLKQASNARRYTKARKPKTPA
jgi:integrase